MILIKRVDEILSNINGYSLDQQQRAVVLSDDDRILVVAGAGSGKSLTMIGKIRYLIEIKGIKEEEILCISFTNDATKNLQRNLEKNYNYKINVYTFHKLALNILKKNNYHFEIAEDSVLESVINNYFNSIIFSYPVMMKLVIKYFGERVYTKKIEKNYRELLDNSYHIKSLERVICRFIHLMKANNYDETSFISFFNDNKGLLKFRKKKRRKILLLLIWNCYKLYKKELEDEEVIDFDDMIILATQVVKKQGVRNKYKYIIIDEYQDTSYVRFLLIKNIIEKAGSKLIVVGDDFQSIYRFTGCDLKLFLDFSSYFEETKIMKIENTYRNSQELIDVAGRFVMRNKHQIRKKLLSDKRLDKPIIIYYYDDIKKCFMYLLEEIYNESKSPIMILGRNNKDIDMVTSKDNFKIESDGTLIYKRNLDIKLRYLTVHKSKGLECDTVIIINLLDSVTGFPSKLEDDEILNYVSIKDDNYPYSEERRLFYVALTRTKNHVYLFTTKSRESMFVKELKKDYPKMIKIVKIY